MENPSLPTRIVSRIYASLSRIFLWCGVDVDIRGIPMNASKTLRLSAMQVLAADITTHLNASTFQHSSPTSL